MLNSVGLKIVENVVASSTIQFMSAIYVLLFIFSIFDRKNGNEGTWTIYMIPLNFPNKLSESITFCVENTCVNSVLGIDLTVVV